MATLTKALSGETIKVKDGSAIEIPPGCEEYVTIVHKQDGYSVIQIQPWLIDPETGKPGSVDKNKNHWKFYVCPDNDLDHPIAGGWEDALEHAKKVITSIGEKETVKDLLALAEKRLDVAEFDKAAAAAKIALNKDDGNDKAIALMKRIENAKLLAEATDAEVEVKQDTVKKTGKSKGKIA